MRGLEALKHTGEEGTQWWQAEEHMAGPIMEQQILG